MKNKWIVLLSPIILLIICFCDKKVVNPVVEDLGYIKILYRLEQLFEPTPTYQTVVWLEDKDNEYITTVYINDWFALGGYNYRDICPSWNSKANWTSTTDLLLDGITSATPIAGEQSIVIDCDEEGLKPGIIKVNIETHIEGKYNMLYSANVTLGSDSTRIEPEVIYIPEKHPIAGNILTDVIFEYYYHEDS